MQHRRPFVRLFVAAAFLGYSFCLLLAGYTYGRIEGHADGMRQRQSAVRGLYETMAPSVRESQSKQTARP